MTKTPGITQFAYLFKKYRLRSEIETLAEFGDLLAQEGIVYETSLFTRWQKGERVPRDRRILIKIITIFIKQGGIQTIEEANNFIESAGQGYLTKDEITSLSNLPYTKSLLSLQNLPPSSTQIQIIRSEPDIKTQFKFEKLKVFFAGSYKGNDSFKKNQIKNLYREIEKLQYEHVDNDFLKVSYNSFVKKMISDKRELALH